MPETISLEEAKALVYTFSYGVYVITTADEKEKFGMTAVWVCQVSKDPVQIGIGVTPTGKTAQTIFKSQKFVVNVLSKEQQSIAYQFGSPSDDPSVKFKDIETGLTDHGIPYIKNSVAWMECEVISEINLNSHYWIIGKVTGGSKNPDLQAALYNNGKIF